MTEQEIQELDTQTINALIAEKVMGEVHPASAHPLSSSIPNESSMSLMAQADVRWKSRELMGL